MKQILIATLISLAIGLAAISQKGVIKDYQRQIDMARIAEATLDYGDGDELSVYSLCEPKTLLDHVKDADPDYANSLFESCNRLNFNY